MIRETVESWAKTTAPITVSAQVLFDRLADDRPHKHPLLIDLRHLDSALPDTYSKGHIPGAINIPWRTILRKEILRSLPRDREIVVYCYNGHIGAQVATALNLLGYDALNLEWGFTSWTCDPALAIGRYIEAEDCRALPTETVRREPIDAYPLPAVISKGPTDAAEIIRKAGDVWLASNRDGEMASDELYGRLMDPDVGTEPFIIDVRRIEEYNKAHIRGAVHMPANEIAKKENIEHIPRNRKIVVYANTGIDEAATVTAILNIMGYDAANLRWGMASWTSDRQAAPGRYENGKCANFPVMKGRIAKDALSVY